jgi:DNA-binding transcriptional ArsR family regulator
MNAFYAIADDTRREIIVLLAKKGELPVNEIAKNFAMTTPAISQHLRVLKEANVILMRKEAQHRLYRIDESGLNEIEIWIEEVRKLWSKRLSSMESYLEKLKKERGIGKK